MAEGFAHSRTILIVDDEPIIRMNLVDFFEDEGFQVYEAESADNAIVVLEAHPDIQIVLTDVQMPGSMNGVKLAHYIRDRWPPTLLIVASGAMAIPQADLPAQSMFIPKPFDPSFVLGEIDRLAA